MYCVLFAKALLMLLLVAMPLVGRAQEQRKLVKTEKLTENITRLIYADGDEEWEVGGRAEGHEKVKFIPTPAPTREEPTPRGVDTARGYITFSPAGRGGVLLEYRPLDSEVRDEVSIFASPGEFEPATFAIRPLREYRNCQL